MSMMQAVAAQQGVLASLSGGAPPIGDYVLDPVNYATDDQSQLVLSKDGIYLFDYPSFGGTLSRKPMTSSFDFTTLQAADKTYDMTGKNAACFSDDGLHMYSFDVGEFAFPRYVIRVRHFTMETPFDIENLVFFDSLVIEDLTIPFDTNPIGVDMQINSGGTKIYLMIEANDGDPNDKLREYSLPTPYMLTGGVQVSETFNWGFSGNRFFINESVDRLYRLIELLQITTLIEYDILTDLSDIVELGRRQLSDNTSTSGEGTGIYFTDDNVMIISGGDMVELENISTFTIP